MDRDEKQGGTTERRGAENAKNAQRRPVAAVISLTDPVPVFIQHTFLPIPHRYPQRFEVSTLLSIR
jgi:hypothetical protein